MRTIQQMVDMTGKTVLITGGAGHLGLAIGHAFAECGAAVAVLDLDKEKCASAIAELNEVSNASSWPVDLEDEARLVQIPGEVADEHGSLDVLVHCAALVGTSALTGWGVPFEDQESETWRKALEVNLTAPFVLTQAAVPHLRASQGNVITIGSIYGVVGPDWRLYEHAPGMGNPAAYAASKGGLWQFTQWLATTLAPEIRANMISIGGVFRNQAPEFVDQYESRVPLQRMATEEDMKGAALFLGSDLSRYVTGQNLMVDGGWTAW